MNNRLLRCIVVSLVLIGAASAQPPTERNREVINRFYTLVDEGHWQEAAKLFAPDVRHHLGERSRCEDVGESDRATRSHPMVSARSRGS